MTRISRHLRVAALAACTLAIFATPHRGASQACDDGAARNLLLTSWVNSALNPPKQEDVEFFTRQGGVPNIMMLVDTSGSMVRLPADGPETLGGGNSQIPTGIELLGSTRDDATPQTNAFNATAAQRPVGCGLDPVSALTFPANPQLRTVMDRRFYPPCGTAVDPALVGAAYQGHDVDYPAQMTVCPYYTSSNSQATGAPGFDPDYYAATDSITQNGKPNFFPRNLIFHDTQLNQPANNWSGTLAFRNNLGDGWDDTVIFPSKQSNSAYDSISTFCARQGTTLQGTMTRAAICQQCLEEAGWYYDGLIFDRSDYGTYYKFPSLWYTGNYLSFFPPKFVIAKKVLKDIIAVQSRIRMAMFKFDSVGSAPIQAFNPTCGQPDNSSFDSNRASYVGTVNGLTFSTGTPLSRALFDVGRYYHTPDLPWFGSTWENSGKESSATANQAAICYSCQSSSVILITDGQPNDGEGNGTQLPPGGLTAAQVAGDVYAGAAATGIQSIAPPLCPQCNAFSPASNYKNNLIKTAFYLHNMDLRRNTETTLDCKGNGGKQALDIYTVGFATATIESANTILVNAAAAGGGMFVAAEDASALKQGIFNIIEQINTRSTSFSVATVSTLQTTAGRSVIVPRFDPSKASLWRGHLSRFDLYSEFVNTCEETAARNGVGDLDCDGRCASVFLQDADGDLISEDSTGVFRKNDPPDLPTCDSAPRCAADGRPCAVPGTAIAAEWWDAGEGLAARAWHSRRVYSAVDENGDGAIDQADGTFELDTATDGPATKLVPYLGLGSPSTGTGVCEALANRLNGVGANAWGALVGASKVECAKAIIRFLKGADLFNDRVDPSFPAASMESASDREFKLGDIFHSSPVVVEPPYPPGGIMCRNGLANQCLPSLWKTPTENGEPAYAGYVEAADYQNRRKVVLVGANDGLLHAFNGGTWRANDDDPTTTSLDESQPPFNGYYERGNLSGGAEELWAFLPPGLLSKIPLLLSSEHNLFADGSPMVRDVWVDGTTNGLAGASAVDDVKDRQEFHTVAVVPLRRGGTHFFALDVTNATEPGAAPSLLWMYPQPNDRRLLRFGETYDSFLPQPPPIGPVRIRADTNGGGVHAKTPEWAMAKGGATRYHERWVAFLNGGFDPQYVRGRGVYMVDVWTGELVWEFAYPDDPSAVDPDDPRLQLKFPVAATVGMAPWGQNAVRDVNELNDWFFDTATFGDVGGQLWALRFSEPAQLDSDGQATNWFGGRVFQMGGAAGCTLCRAQPFFYMTGNVRIADSGYYRVFAGTGDRFNLLDKGGGQCGPDNIRACVMRGCTVNIDAPSTRLGTTDLGSRSWSLSQTACGATSVGGSAGTITDCGAGGDVRITISGCPSPSPNTAPTTTYKRIEVACQNQSDGEYACRRVQNDPGSKLSLSDTTNAPNVGNWFYSLLAFEETGDRAIFVDEQGAKDYDASRLWVTQSGATRSASPGIVMMSGSVDAPSPIATAISKGWAVFYDHGPTIVADSHTYNVSWMDERTTTGMGMGSNVVTWSSIQTTTGEVTSANAGCRTSQCTAVDRRVSYRYNADPITGAPALTDPISGDKYRFAVSTKLVPPQGAQTTVFVNQQGQVAVGLTDVSTESGATNVGMSEPMEAVYGTGILEVSRDAHACRHAWPGSEARPPETPAQEVCR